MKKYFLLTTTVLTLFAATPVTHADTMQSVSNEIQKVDKQLTDAKYKESHKSIVQRISELFTSHADEESDVDKLSKKLYKLHLKKSNLYKQETSTKATQLNTTSQHNMESKKEAKKKADEEAKRKADEEAKRKADEEAQAKAQEAEKAKTEASKQSSSQPASQPQASQAPSYTPVTHDGIQFGSDGLLVMQSSSKAQQAINLLLGIPGHSNGSGYHASTGLDSLIDSLSTPEALYVLHQIEGAGYGQTASGYAGMDTPESHKALVSIQLNGRFGGSIHELLKHWGTYSYGGY